MKFISFRKDLNWKQNSNCGQTEHMSCNVRMENPPLKIKSDRNLVQFGSLDDS